MILDFMKKIICIIFISVLLGSCSTSKQAAQKKSEKEAKELIEFAYKCVNTPYLYGGTTPRGFDCSGYVQFVYKKIGYSLPRSTKEQAQAGAKVEKTKLQKGDLVFFKGKNSKSKEIGHVGIVTQADRGGEFNFIHAASTGVKVDNSELPYYRIRYVTARRIIGSQ